MAGEVNLEVVADIARAKAQMAEFAATLKTIERQTGAATEKAGALEKNLTQAGRALTRIGQGGVIMAVVAALKQAAEMAERWEAAAIRASAGRAKTQLGETQLAARLPVGAAKALATTMGWQERGAARGLMPEDVTGLAGDVIGKMKKRPFAEQQAAVNAAIDLYAATGDREAAIKAARRPGGAAVAAAATRRQAAILSVDPNLAAQATNRQLEARFAFEKLFPQSEEARRRAAAENEARRESLERAGAYGRRGVDVSPEAGFLGQHAGALKDMFGQGIVQGTVEELAGRGDYNALQGGQDRAARDFVRDSVQPLQDVARDMRAERESSVR